MGIGKIIFYSILVCVVFLVVDYFRTRNEKRKAKLIEFPKAWEGYLIMTFMIALGVLLRHSPVPKSVLAPIYTAVGASLGLASLRYFRALVTRSV